MTPTRQRRPVVLLRPIPGTSVIHELWAGTKIIVVFAISLLLAFYPGWVPIALWPLLLVLTAKLARIPRGVLPSIPRWLWILLLLGGVTATLGGGEPVLHLWSQDVEVGGLLKFLRFTALSIVLLGWGPWCRGPPTSPTSPRPSPRWAGRCGRCASRSTTGRWRWRWRCAPSRCCSTSSGCSTPPGGCGPGQCCPTAGRAAAWLIEMVDLLAAGVTVALRRADEMGDAITARGGTGQISAAPSRPRAPTGWRWRSAPRCARWRGAGDRRSRLTGLGSAESAGANAGRRCWPPAGQRPGSGRPAAAEEHLVEVRLDRQVTRREAGTPGGGDARAGEHREKRRDVDASLAQ